MTEDQVEASTLPNPRRSRSRVVFERSAECGAGGVLQLASHALPRPPGFLQPVSGMEEPRPNEKMPKGREPIPFQKLAEVGPGQANLLSHLFRRPPAVNRVHGQEDHLKFAAGEIRAQTPGHQRCGAPLRGPCQSPVQLTFKVFQAQQNQVSDSRPAQPEESEWVPVPLDQQDQPHVGEAGSEPRQRPLQEGPGLAVEKASLET